MDVRIPRGNLIVPGEMSFLTSTREPGSINHLWQPAAQSQGRNTDGANSSAQLARAVNQALAKRPSPSTGMHPFKIYQLPFQYRYTALSDPSTAWRAFRVRNGLILNTTIDPTSGPCDGTDEVDQYYSDVFISQADGSIISGVTDIIVPSGVATYYIWVDIAGNSISYGDDPTSPDHGSAWASFPTDDTNYSLVGWVDTDTLSDIGRSIVTQVQTTHVLPSGGGSSVQYIPFYQAMAWYTVCKDSGGNYHAVARPTDIQYTAASTTATYYGTSATIAYPHDPAGSVAESSDHLAYIYRSVTISGSTEHQGICPPYQATSTQGAPTSLICCISADTGLVTASGDTLIAPGTPITLQEVSARAWTAFSNQSF